MWRIAFRSVASVGAGVLAAPVVYSAVQSAGNELRPGSQYDVYMPSFPRLVAKNSRVVLDALLRPKALGSPLETRRVEFACFNPLTGPSKKEFKMNAALSLDGFDVLHGDALTLYCPHDLVVPYTEILLQVPVRRDPSIGIAGAPAAAYELVRLTSEGDSGFRRAELARALQDFFEANESLVRWRELDFIRFEGTHEAAGGWIPLYRAYMFTSDRIKHGVESKYQ